MLFRLILFNLILILLLALSVFLVFYPALTLAQTESVPPIQPETRAIALVNTSYAMDSPYSSPHVFQPSSIQILNMLATIFLAVGSLLGSGLVGQIGNRVSNRSFKRHL